MRDWNRASKKAKANDNLKKMRRRKKRIIEAIQILRGKCQSCGAFNPEFLQVHHKDPSKKLFNAGQYHSVSYRRFLAEIKKCGLLCSQCHTQLHRLGPEALGLTSDWLIGDVEEQKEDIGHDNTTHYLDDEEWDELFE